MPQLTPTPAPSPSWSDLANTFKAALAQNSPTNNIMANAGKQSFTPAGIKQDAPIVESAALMALLGHLVGTPLGLQESPMTSPINISTHPSPSLPYSIPEINLFKSPAEAAPENYKPVSESMYNPPFAKGVKDTGEVHVTTSGRDFYPNPEPGSLASRVQPKDVGTSHMGRSVLYNVNKEDPLYPVVYGHRSAVAPRTTSSIPMLEIKGQEHAIFQTPDDVHAAIKKILMAKGMTEDQVEDALDAVKARTARFVDPKEQITTSPEKLEQYRKDPRFMTNRTLDAVKEVIGGEPRVRGRDIISGQSTADLFRTTLDKFTKPGGNQGGNEIINLRPHENVVPASIFNLYQELTAGKPIPPK